MRQRHDTRPASYLPARLTAPPALPCLLLPLPADVWANPVAYDKLGVRYRRWRNSGGWVGGWCSNRVLAAGPVMCLLPSAGI